MGGEGDGLFQTTPRQIKNKVSVWVAYVPVIFYMTLKYKRYTINFTPVNLLYTHIGWLDLGKAFDKNLLYYKKNQFR